MSIKNIQSGLVGINNHLVRMAFLAEEQIRDSIRALEEIAAVVVEELAGHDVRPADEAHAFG